MARLPQGLFSVAPRGFAIERIERERDVASDLIEQAQLIDAEGIVLRRVDRERRHRLVVEADGKRRHRAEIALLGLQPPR